MKFVTDLNAAVVVERRGLEALDTAKMAEAMKDIYGRGKPVIVVDNMRQFFSTKNLMAVLDNPEQASLIGVLLEQKGIDLQFNELETIKAYHQLKAKILEASSGVAGYDFAPVPDGWNIEDKVVINKNTIRRSNGFASESVGKKTLEEIWKRASRIWNGDGNEGRFSMRVAGYYRDVTVTENLVAIGCQNVKRFELEQLAVHQGWTFPDTRA